MVRSLEGRSDIFLCEECGLGYTSEAKAQECEAFCKTHNACSLQITQAAVYRPR